MGEVLIVALVLVGAYFLYTKVIRPRMNGPTPTPTRGPGTPGYGYRDTDTHQH